MFVSTIKTTITKVTDIPTVTIQSPTYISLLTPTTTFAGSQNLYVKYDEYINNNWSLTPATSTIQGNNQNLSNINLGNISTLSTSVINLDGNILTTASGAEPELLLNGVPIATVSSITAIEDWSFYPSLSTIQGNNNNLNGITVGTISSLISDTVNVGSAVLTATDSTLFLNGLQVATVSTVQNWSLDPAISTVNFQNFDLKNVSTINGDPYITGGGASTWSLFNAIAPVDFAQQNLNNVSTINGGVYVPTSNWSAFNAVETIKANNNSVSNCSGVQLTTAPDLAVILTAGTGNVLNVNGVPVSGGGSVSTWANFPAISTVTIQDRDLTMSTTTPGVAYNNCNLNANVVIGTTSQSPLRPDLTAYCGTVSMGGLANPLTAMNIYSLGTVTVNSALGLSLTGGGGVSVSGGGGIVATGATVTIGTGALDVVGGSINLGAGTINMVGGLINALGTAVNVGGGLITATSGGLLVQSGTVTVGSSDINGGGIICYGGKIQCATSLAGGTGGLEMNNCPITGVSTINGLPYNPIRTGIIDYATISGSEWITIGTFGQYYSDFSLGFDLNTTSIILTTMINATDQDKADSCWIINVTPNGDSAGGLRIVCASNPTVGTGEISIAWILSKL